MLHAPFSLFAFLCIAMIAVPAAALVPVASFSASPTAGPAPLAVSFTDASTGTPTGWAWYFGDENYTASAWTQQVAHAPWAPRYLHVSVNLPDGSIVLMGGTTDSGVSALGNLNDTWRSTDQGVTWTQQTTAAAWSARRMFSGVALPDGSIVIMGGYAGDTRMNDVWRSTDQGATWTCVNASAGWPSRFAFTSAALPDSNIVLMGGTGARLYNDVWRSTDMGATWTRTTANAGWSWRERHASVVLPDGSIVLMGGNAADGIKNDTWLSTDQGATWTEQTDSAAWSARYAHASVALPDGSIVLMGGCNADYAEYKWNDVWRSMDKGVTWTCNSASAGWSPRTGAKTVVLPDGSIVLMGGSGVLFGGGSDGGFQNDVWRLATASSTAQDPSHVYTVPGTYSVAVRASNAGGYSDTIRQDYVTVTEGPAVQAIPPSTDLPGDTNGDGLYDDVNGNGRPDFADVVLYFNQMTWIAENEPVGAFDYNGNGRIDFADVVWLFNNL